MSEAAELVLRFATEDRARDRRSRIARAVSRLVVGSVVAAVAGALGEVAVAIAIVSLAAAATVVSMSSRGHRALLALERALAFVIAVVVLAPTFATIVVPLSMILRRRSRGPIREPGPSDSYWRTRDVPPRLDRPY